MALTDRANNAALQRAARLAKGRKLAKTTFASPGFTKIDINDEGKLLNDLL